MAMPIGAIAGSLAAVCGHNHNEARDELNIKYYEDLEKLKEKSSLILDYLKKTFKVDNVVVDEEFDINSTIYNLRFGYMGIGIRISNEMIINADIEYLYRYSYDLVFNELIKITKQKYVNLESFED